MRSIISYYKDYELARDPAIIMAINWTAQMLSIACVIVTAPAMSSQVISAMASLGTIWTVGLSVLGIYVYKRSHDKQLKSGQIAPNKPIDFQNIIDQFFKNKS